jgi:hypothetical protein
VSPPPPPFPCVGRTLPPTLKLVKTKKQGVFFLILFPASLTLASSPFSPGGDNLNLGGHLSGEFAVVIFDKLAGRVLAARDHRGAELLFWGTSNFGEMLLISTDRRVLEMNCADADAFPPGTLFCSKDGEVTGWGCTS